MHETLTVEITEASKEIIVCIAHNDERYRVRIDHGGLKDERRNALQMLMARLGYVISTRLFPDDTPLYSTEGRKDGWCQKYLGYAEDVAEEKREFVHTFPWVSKNNHT